LWSVNLGSVAGIGSVESSIERSTGTISPLFGKG